MGHSRGGPERKGTQPNTRTIAHSVTCARTDINDFPGMPNAPVLLRAICYQGALQSFSYELDSRSTQRLSRARLQQLPLGGRALHRDCIADPFAICPESGPPACVRPRRVVNGKSAKKGSTNVKRL